MGTLLKNDYSCKSQISGNPQFWQFPKRWAPEHYEDPSKQNVKRRGYGIDIYQRNMR